MREQKIVLALEVMEEGPARDAGAGRDLVERRRLIAVHDKQLHGDVGDALQRLAPVPLAQALCFRGPDLRFATLPAVLS
jgi:hypothetical protein